ncbi:MAG: efflux RND transporter permease subunit, partial [Deltaproteobacteria bacterium]|nr:efflux RND transporter permease subunit [Deltaproteobacteria bacterium]
VISGVQKVQLIGEISPSVKFRYSPADLFRFGLSPSTAQQIIQQISKQNPSGCLDLGSSRLNFTLDSNVKSLVQMLSKKIPLEDGEVELAEMGELTVEPENFDTQARFNGKPSVFVGVFVNPVFNALTVLSEVKKKLNEIQISDSQHIKSTIPYDSSVFINASINEILKTLVETIIIVGLVVFISLRNLKTSVVIFCSIPLSLLGVLPFLWLMGYSINLLTILAIVLSVGIVVDDSIIVMESALKKVSKGSSILEAGKSAVHELWKPMLILNLTLIALFAPFFFQSGLTADLFKEFAFTIILATLTSLVVAFTIIPPLLKFVSKLGQVEIFDWSKIELKYDLLLQKLIRRKIFLIVILLALIVSTPFVLRLPPKDFLPKEDRSVLLTVVETPTSASPARISQILDEWYMKVKEIPQVRHVFQLGSTGFSFGGVGLKPYEERKETAFDVEKVLYKISSELVSAKLIPINPPPLPSSGTFPIEIALKSSQLDTSLTLICENLTTRLRKTQIFSFLNCAPKIDKLYSTILVNESKLNKIGIPTEFFLKELSALSVNRFISLLPADGRIYRIYSQRKNMSSLEDLKLTPFHYKGKQLYIGSFIDFDFRTSLNAVKQVNQSFSVILQGAPAPGVALGTAVETAEDIVKSVLPKQYSYEFLGDSRQYKRNIAESLKIYILSGATILGLFLIATGSVVLSIATIGSAFVLAFWMGHFICFILSTSANFYSAIGMLILVGLVTKNYVIIIFRLYEKMRANEQPSSPEKLIVESCVERLRPIVMTSVSTIAGHMPLLFVTGAGAVARNSIGSILVPGMIFLTIFSLLGFPILLAICFKFLNLRKK